MGGTGIGKEWAQFARGWLGHADGRHCHWCEHILLEEGEAHCIHPESKFNDGDRIRTWDAHGCAMECQYFVLSSWYRDDKNLRDMRAQTEAE